MNRIIKIVILLFSASLIYAQEGDGQRVVVLTSAKNPVAGSAWTITLLAAYHDPNDVNVLAPHFTGYLSLNEVVKVSRFYNPSTGQVIYSQNEVRSSATPWSFERWTAVEFRFTLNSPGVVNFDAFTVIAPPWQVKTAPFDLTIYRPRDTSQAQSRRLVWEGIPASLVVGENAVLGLRVSGWNPAELPLETGLFLPPVPPGHILESLSLTSEEKSEGIALKLRLIPLQAGPFVLESRRISHDSGVFEVPALRIPVNRAADSLSSDDAVGVGENAPEKIAAMPFPPLETAIEGRAGSLYQKHRTECAAVYATARNLWEKGDIAGALASLRQNERDHPAGAFFAVIRRSAEQTIGLSGTRDEKRSLRSFFGGAAKEKPHRTQKGEFPSTSAVLRETIVRRVPHLTGTEIARFREGQPVLLDKKYPAVREGRTVWLRVTSNDNTGTSGWVADSALDVSETIIFY